ncbi:MAG: NAD(P)H-binding protein [Pseudonocardiaceae bacterium]
MYATGATGTVGRHVVDQLVQSGQAVRALTRDPGVTLPAGVEIVRGDLIWAQGSGGPIN